MTRACEKAREGAEMDKAAPDPLAAIRNRIDAIDEEMHKLLIDRSGVIAELIEIKGTSKPGAAFRPEREADMMRRLALRHDGTLPLFTVEHIWREIITTFTAMQAPFGIAAGPADDALAMRDLIRFYFGFSIPVTNCESSAAAIKRAAASGQHIAVVAADRKELWWEALTGPAAPKVFAKLPFLEIAGHPARLPAYVIGPPLQESAVFDVQLFAMPDADRLEAAVLSHGGAIISRNASDLLVELPIAATLDDLARESGQPPPKAKPLGGFFQPIRSLAERSG
jgi:chorismate mutase/prephenate dehydratase